MNIVFDQPFTAWPWPGPLEGSEASFGETWVGPSGLLTLLQTATGTGGPVPPEAERVVAFARELQSLKGCWAQSFSVDQTGTARRLLAWRDTLRMAGWDGQSGTGRIGELATLEAIVPPGFPDRLAAVLEAIPGTCVDIERIQRLVPGDDLPELWDRLFQALACQDVAIEDMAPPPAGSPPDSNLAGAKAGTLEPVNPDESLQLLRAPGPLEAAERLAAWMARLPADQTTVVIGADTVLDRALHRHGLPPSGASYPAAEHGLLQILPLVLEAGRDIPDPQRILELLGLPCSPIRRALASRLIDALHEQPAVGSDAWQAALEDGLGSIEDVADRRRVEENLRNLFSADTRGDETYPADAVIERVDRLNGWLQSRLARDGEDTVPWSAGLNQVAAFNRLVIASGLDRLDRPELQRLLGEATVQVSQPPLYEAKAGLAHVNEPGEVAGPVDRVVWWNFSASTVRPPSRLPFLPAELADLTAQGVRLPDPALQAAAAATRWRRPFDQAIRGLVFSCPLRDEAGEEIFPHPLWDEITAGIPTERVEQVLVTSLLQPDATGEWTQRDALERTVPQRSWGAPPVPAREMESPSGAGILVGCPFRYVVQYRGHIYAGTSARLSEDRRLLGSLAHELLARVLSTSPAGSDAAEDLAAKLFDQDGPKLAAALFLPGKESLRAATRRITLLAAKELARFIESADLTVESVEENITGSALGMAFGGRPDLVLRAPRRVVDLKWSGSTFRHRQLTSGTAYQLAAYGLLLAGAGEPPVPGAYFTLDQQRLLTTDEEAFPGAEVVDGPTPAETWRYFEASYAANRGDLDAGTVVATGVADGEEEPPDKDEIHEEDGTMILAPPCRFCDFGRICGVDFTGTGTGDR